MLRLHRVAAAEEIQMVENVIQIVEVFSLLESVLKRKLVLVSRVKTSWETSEKLRKGEVGFAVAVVDRRVKNDGGSISQKADVTRPKVAVKK